MKASSDGIILYNGKIYTQEAKFPLATALVVQGNRIIDLGRDLIAKNYPSRKFKRINLKQKTILPAFTDCHTHFLGYVRNLAKLDLEKTQSLSGALELIKKFTQTKKPGEWVLGYNWDAHLWKNSPPPDKKALDQISTSHPMSFSARDGHQLWVNSLALKLAGIDDSTPDVSGGQILRYPNSLEPAGILKDRARERVFRLVPEQINSDSVAKAIKNLHRKGITAIHNMENGESLSFFRELESKGRLGLRVWQTIARNNLDDAMKIGLRTGFGSEKLKIGGVKIFADGALGSRTALMFEPYENEPDNLGLEIISRSELTELIQKAAGAGISAVIHAIGDKANYHALMALSEVKNARHLRHRIEHAQIVRPEDLELFARLWVIASIQPIHCPHDYAMALKYWGERNVNAYPIASLLKRKVKICFGSDFPLYDFDPILGIYSAVNRKLPDSNSPIWNSSQRISIRDAVLAYTKDAAFAAGWEKELGTLSPGKLADLVVLAEDIYSQKPEKIDRVKVAATIFDGNIVGGDLG